MELFAFNARLRDRDFKGAHMQRIIVLLAINFSVAFLFGTAGRAHPMGCLPQMVRSALAKVDAVCGIKVISTLRIGARISGTGHVSKHASCRAADFTSSDYSCVRRVLAGYSGAMSVDPFRAGHVHIDDGQHLRFAHGGGRKRYAKYRSVHRRYAQRDLSDFFRPEDRTP